MITAKRALLGALCATGLTIGGAAVRAATAPALPTPVVWASTLTLPNRDSVALLVNWTNQCNADKQCPTQWQLITTTTPWDTITHFRITNHDTIAIAKPFCPMTFVSQSRVTAQGSNIESKAGNTSVTIQCRPKTAAEIAFADTFPAANWTMVAFRHDSSGIVHIFPKDSADGNIGQVLEVCYLAKNRYTLHWEVPGPDPEGKCAAVRAVKDAQ